MLWAVPTRSLQQNHLRRPHQPLCPCLRSEWWRIGIFQSANRAVEILKRGWFIDGSLVQWTLTHELCAFYLSIFLINISILCSKLTCLLCSAKQVLRPHCFQSKIIQLETGNKRFGTCFSQVFFRVFAHGSSLPKLWSSNGLTSIFLPSCTIESLNFIFFLLSQSLPGFPFSSFF